jgi:hypothetical protein
MSQKTDLLKLFRANGNRLTLGPIKKTSFWSEYRARFSDLRGDGHVIVCDDKDKPSPIDNIYTLVEEPEARNAAKIAEYRKIQATYPPGHRQREAIETQIKGIEGKIGQGVSKYVQTTK